MTEREPAPLSPDAVRHLRELVARMENHHGPWATVGGGERLESGAFSMPWVDMNGLASEAMQFLYDNGLIIPFEWGKWDEGREMFQNRSDDRFEGLERLTVVKLLTAVARNDRFCEGAWASLFEEGDAQKLFSRLLAMEQRDSTQR